MTKSLTTCPVSCYCRYQHGPARAVFFHSELFGVRKISARGVRSHSRRGVVTVSDTQATWLTQDAYDRLKGELDELVAERPAIAAKINEAREEGDLKENGGYHAAREEQAQLEGRVRQLQELLRNAKVGDVPTESGVARPGSVLTVRFDGEDEEEKFLLANREEGAHGELEVYSPNSPLGQALLDANEGDVCEYDLPNGGKMQVTLIKAEPFQG
nr:transcription elongation factor GreA [Actinopolyspora biskrensis]